MKIKTQYSCQSCGYTTAKWLGRCRGCDGWSCVVEERTSPANDQTVSALRNEFKTFKEAKEDEYLENIGPHGALMTGKPWVALDGDEKDEQPLKKRVST